MGGTVSRTIPQGSAFGFLQPKGFGILNWRPCLWRWRELYGVCLRGQHAPTRSAHRRCSRLSGSPQMAMISHFGFFIPIFTLSRPLCPSAQKNERSSLLRVGFPPPLPLRTLFLIAPAKLGIIIVLRRIKQAHPNTNPSPSSRHRSRPGCWGRQSRPG